jgi:hypothetical protein
MLEKMETTLFVDFCVNFTAAESGSSVLHADSNPDPGEPKGVQIFADDADFLCTVLICVFVTLCLL